ncbi:Uncharacterised protein [uncultured archaeon]|nr:Uncharacterised protein [uncultured archaeon]
MKKTNPFLTASTASVLYFIVFIMLKYFLENEIPGWQSAVSGALAFWFFIFLVHQYLNRAKPVP